jgi:hypothetical protein
MGDHAEIVGNIGVLLFLASYFLLQKEKVTHSSLSYLGMNLLGAILLVYSLLFHWNLPAFLLEASWALISIYGIYKYHYRTKRNKT